MKKRQRTAKQRLWHDWLANQGCYLRIGNANLHHCVGASALHKKVWIGQDFVIPLSYEAHQGKGGIHGDLSIFDGHGLGTTRKEIEKTIFRRLVSSFYSKMGSLPCEPDVLAAIEDYHR